jgi:hypothetical protein
MSDDTHDAARAAVRAEYEAARAHMRAVWAAASGRAWLDADYQAFFEARDAFYAAQDRLRKVQARAALDGGWPE